METLHRYAALGALGLLLLLPVQLRAQGIAGQQCADPTASFLWEVQSPALHAEGGSLHLFGSIHIGKPDFYPLPARLESLLQNADQLVFEVNPQVAEEPQVALQMALRGMLPGGQTLDQVLSAATLQNLEAVLQELGLPLANFMNYKPWMLAVVLTGLQSARQGFDPAWGVESYLLRHKSPDTGILELESWQEQLDMLEALDPELLLDYSLEEFRTSEAMLETLAAAWLCGEQDILAGIVLDPVQEEQAEVYEAMFVRRNEIMAEGVAELARQGDGQWLVVVGTGHLLGADSVVELLRQQGFAVQTHSLLDAP